MQPFPIAYMPQVPPPCFSLRSRREVQATDLNNSRLVEHWQTDSPALTNSLRGVQGTSRYMDMSPTPSRLYREDMQPAQPYVVPSQDPEFKKMLDELDKKIRNTLQRIQLTQEEARLEEEKELYKALVDSRRRMMMDNMNNNPYFETYDVKGDSRNIVRELQSAVKEDISDRGVEQSRRLLQRGMESRWIGPKKEEDGIDSLTAFELMRPKINKQEKVYHS